MDSSGVLLFLCLVAISYSAKLSGPSVKWSPYQGSFQNGTETVTVEHGQTLSMHCDSKDHMTFFLVTRKEMENCERSMASPPLGTCGGKGGSVAVRLVINARRYNPYGHVWPVGMYYILAFPSYHRKDLNDDYYCHQLGMKLKLRVVAPHSFIPMILDEITVTWIPGGDSFQNSLEEINIEHGQTLAMECAKGDHMTFYLVNEKEMYDCERSMTSPILGTCGGRSGSTTVRHIMKTGDFAGNPNVGWPAGTYYIIAFPAFQRRDLRDDYYCNVLGMKLKLNVVNSSKMVRTIEWRRTYPTLTTTETPSATTTMTERLSNLFEAPPTDMNPWLFHRVVKKQLKKKTHDKSVISEGKREEGSHEKQYLIHDRTWDPAARMRKNGTATVRLMLIYLVLWHHL